MYRTCLREKHFETALNYLYPIQDTLEVLEIICSDHLGDFDDLLQEDIKSKPFI